MTTPNHIIEIMQKAARCWSGYEPVPGAKAYSEGSCRPKGSKKTKKEVIQGKKHTEKKAAQPGLQYSNSPLTMAQAQAAQKEFMSMGAEFPMYKQMEGAKSPMDVRNGLEQYLRQNRNRPLKAFDYRIEKILGGKYVPHSAADGNFPQPAAPAQPATPGQAPQAPQQTAATSVKPPMPPSPVTSPQPAPPPATSRPRPGMTQKPVDPVPAIDARLQRKGIDPNKPVFAKPAPTPPVTPQIVQNVTRPK
jgi:hypothetical protein